VERSSPKEEQPFTLPRLDTVGEVRPGTGLLPLTGLGQPGKPIKVELPDLSNVVLPPVKLSVTIPPETSRFLDAAASRLPLLLDALLAAAGLFGVGKLGPWVMPVVSGLGTFLQGLSRLRIQQPSGVEIKSPVVNPVEVTSIPKREF